ncbi:hypothetical protein [Enterococcus hulanensis]|uniref:hypothetical protein n=1 Tax=Enterococcus hulanensis TaxID=2559929 RepID=UPI001484D565|nr:hypothetical protein [Enterococcus hulanensis]
MAIFGQNLSKSMILKSNSFSLRKKREKRCAKIAKKSGPKPNFGLQPKEKHLF